MLGQRRNFFVLVLVIVCIELGVSALETSKLRSTMEKMALPEVRDYFHRMAQFSTQNAQKAFEDAKNYMMKVHNNIGQEGGLRQSLGLRPRFAPRPSVGSPINRRGRGPQSTPGGGNVYPTSQVSESYRRPLV